MLVDSNYVKTYLALPREERRQLRLLFKSYDETKLMFTDYNAREMKYTAIEYTYQNYHTCVLLGLYDKEK